LAEIRVTMGLFDSMLLPRVVDPLYSLPEGARWTRRAGLYNSYALFVALLWMLWTVGLCPLWLVTLQSVSLVGALTLDDRCVVAGSALSCSALPEQLCSYRQLAQSLLADVWVMWVGPVAAFVVFARVHDSWLDAHSPLLLGSDFICSHFGLFLYCVYQSVRALYLVVALVWDGAHHARVRRRELLWSYLLGNIGLVVRCFRYDALKWCGRMLAHLVPGLVVAESSLWAHLAFLLVTGWLSWGQIAFSNVDNYLFYKVHRTLHASHPLFSLCHALHHRALYPTLLDSGTISPLELVLTEFSLPVVVLLWPPVIAVGYELGYSMVGHLIGHTAGFHYGGTHHHIHHKLQHANFGLQAHFDKMYGTLAMH
jgi:hypothetical protein